MVFTKTVESILYGFAVTLVKMEILSEKEEEIEDFIMNEIKRGISKYNVIGGYSPGTHQAGYRVLPTGIHADQGNDRQHGPQGLLWWRLLWFRYGARERILTA